MDYKTGLAFFPAFDWHISKDHPEREERLLYTYDQLREEGIFDLKQLLLCSPKDVPYYIMERTHLFFNQNHHHQLEASHKIALGSLLSLADARMNGTIKNGFALIRPPGHHAMHSVWGGRGFCYINHEAILAHYLQNEYGVKKIAIIDTDCHHGDGTQDIFYLDQNILFISIHQDGKTLYPGTGFINEKGSPYALNTYNFPLAPETGEQGFIDLIEKKVVPLINEFQPEIIINSAGQDNHYTDPLTNMRFSSKGYAEITKLIKPDIVVLEGGYSVEGALPYVNLGILLSLMDKDLSFIKEPDYSSQKVAQTQAHDKMIQSLIENTETLSDRANIKKQNFMKDKKNNKSSIYTYNQNIYYDTDGIMESQEKNHHACEHCNGFGVTYSKTEKGKGCGVTIFKDTCEPCTSKAISYYQALLEKDQGFTVILQNRKSDQYLRSK